MNRKKSLARPYGARQFLVLAAAILATTGLAAAMGKIALKSSERVDRTVPVDVLKRIRLSNTGGNIIVTGAPGAQEITISATKSVWEKTPKRGRQALRQLDISFATRGDLLEVRPTYPENWTKTFEVEYFVTVPASFRVEAVSANGAIQIRNVRDVDVSGGGGDVLLAGVQTVTVKTTTGDVEVGATAGPIDVATTRGKVRAQLVGAVHSVRVFTVSGDVILQVPPNLGAELGITTTSGIVNTRGLTMRDAEQTRFGLKATVNDGGVPIEVTSTTGAVTVTTHDIGPATIRAISPPGRTAPVTPAVEAPPPPAPEPTPPPAPAPAPATMEQPAAPAAPPAAEGAAPDTSGARGPAAGQPGQ